MLIKFSEYLSKLKIEQDTTFYDVSAILLDSYRKGSVISPNQIEPFPSIFNQFVMYSINTLYIYWIL